ncbi:MAG: hypothetical protein Q9210_001326 [Variospora velana]
MSGLEALGAAGSIAGLLDFAAEIFRISRDIIHAKQEKQQFRNVLEALQEQLRNLRKLQQDAQGYPEELYFISLFQESKASQPAPGDQRGALLGMATSMKRMEHKLRERSSFKRRLVRLKWTLDKEEVQDLVSEIQEWRSQIQTVMQQDLLKLTMKSLQLQIETKSDVGGIKTVTDKTQDLTQGIVLTTGKTAEQTQRIETLTAATQGVTQSIALTSDAIAARSQSIEGVGEDSNNRLRSIEADSLALRLRKKEKDKKNLKLAIADWLSRLDFNARHREVYDRHIDINQEFIESSEFQAWSSGRPWILFCWADAGAGKTMLSSIVIEHLRTRFKSREIPILCLYLNHKEQSVQSPRTLMGSLLKQLVQYRDYKFCSDDLIKRYKEKARGVGLSLQELQEAFCSEIMHYERVFVIVDALDEGSSEASRSYAVISRQDLPLGRLCIMITSRELPPDAEKGIRCDGCDKDQGTDCGKSGHTLSEPYKGEEVYKQVDPSEKAIREYVRKEIHGDVQTHRRGRAELGLYKKQPGTTLLGRLCQKDDKLEANIVETVCARADRKFLLAKLYVESLRAKLNRREIMDALQELPPGYAGVYETTMERIKAYSMDDPRSSATLLALTVLSWVVHTHRPLDLPELQHALAIRLKEAFSEDNIYDEEEILQYTAGLITVASDNGAVRVSHYTVQEYFMGFGKHWLPQNANSQIARACLHYMRIDDLVSPCDSSQEEKELEERKEQYPFIRYSYEYWGNHARDAVTDPDTSADALDFLKDPLRVATLVQAIWYLESSEAAKWEIRRGANALHIAAWFGLTDAIDDLVEEGIDINAKDPYHEQTPLIYASRRGHFDTVEKLIELGAFVNNRSARGRTSLVEAVSEGHLPVVQVLLKQYRLVINEIQPWDFGRSVLMLAVIKNDLDIVDALLGRRDISINQKDSKGYSALMLAASFGFVNIGERLLAHADVDVNVTSRYGTTALIHAAACENQHNGKVMTELLLDHEGIDTSIRDQQGGGTALIRAVDYDNLEVVESLLHRNVAISQKDHQGRGLLHAAAIHDRCEIATFLIERGIPVNVKDEQDRTPLHDAARCGNEAMIRLLLERGANFRLKDSSGRAPATVACQNGRTTAFQLFKEKSTDGTKTPDSSLPDPESLPVWSLVKLGREDIIKRKISQRSRDPFALSHLDPDTDDTPVHCAISAERPSILRLLLSANLSPGTQNALFRSPLHCAAESPITTLIEILLSASPILDPRDVTGTTPLFLAYTSNRPLNALLLVEAGAEIEEKALILPLFFAAIDYERIAAVKMLMKKHKAPILAKNKRGESALQIAKARGLVEIQRLLDGNKSYANNRSLAFGEGENLDLTASVRGPFTRPEAWEEEEDDEEEKGQQPLRLEDFPSVDAGEIRVEEATNKAQTLVAAT